MADHEATIDDATNESSDECTYKISLIPPECKLPKKKEKEYYDTQVELNLAHMRAKRSRLDLVSLK